MSWDGSHSVTAASGPLAANDTNVSFLTLADGRVFNISGNASHGTATQRPDAVSINGGALTNDVPYVLFFDVDGQTEDDDPGEPDPFNTYQFSIKLKSAYDDPDVAPKEPAKINHVVIAYITASSAGGTVEAEFLLQQNAGRASMAKATNAIANQTITAALIAPSQTLAADISGTAATVTTNANLTGHVTSSGNAAVLGSFTSAQLSGALTNETGSGVAVFNTSPTLITPALGTPASGVMTNVSGTASSLTAGLATLATSITASANNTTNETVYPTFVDGATGTQGLETDTGLTYNPSTGLLSLVTLSATDSIALPTAVANDSVPTGQFGLIKFAEDGGHWSDGSGSTSLGFLFNQTSGTPERDTALSSFWSMTGESDGSSGSRIIFEAIIPEGASDVSKNRSFIGYHNPLNSLYSDYLNASYGSATFPGFAFMGDYDTGMYRLSANIIGFASAGLAICGMYASDLGGGSFAGGIYPTTDDRYDLGTGSYRWDDIFATSGTVNSSDLRLKENIQSAKLGLDFINDLNPITYKWKKKNKKKVDATHHGIIAQEVVETLKDYGIDSLEDFAGITHDEDDETYYGARYTEFIPILMKAIQELSAEVKELKEKI